jgi:hypothetical protein
LGSNSKFWLTRNSYANGYFPWRGFNDLATHEVARRSAVEGQVYLAASDSTSRSHHPHHVLPSTGFDNPGLRNVARMSETGEQVLLPATWYPNNRYNWHHWIDTPGENSRELSGNLITTDGRSGFRQEHHQQVMQPSPTADRCDAMRQSGKAQTGEPQIEPNNSQAMLNCGYSRKMVRFDPAFSQRNNTRLRHHSILRRRSEDVFMTTPFSVTFHHLGHQYIVQFPSIPAKNASIENFESCLLAAVPKDQWPCLRASLDEFYKLRIRRLLRTATAIISGDDSDCRAAAFTGFLNCVFAEATVSLVW